MTTNKQFLSAAALSAGLAMSGSAFAQDWKAVGEYGWVAVGKAYEIEKGHIYWMGETSGTFFNDKGKGSLHHHSGLKCPTWNDIQLNAKKNHGAGYCIVSDPDGDQANLTFTFEGDTQSVKGTYEYTGGTGKYKEITGKYTFWASFQVNWPDGGASGYSVWNR